MVRSFLDLSRESLLCVLVLLAVSGCRQVARRDIASKDRIQPEHVKNTASGNDPRVDAKQAALLAASMTQNSRRGNPGDIEIGGTGNNGPQVAEPGENTTEPVFVESPSTLDAAIVQSLLVGEGDYASLENAQPIEPTAKPVVTLDVTPREISPKPQTDSPRAHAGDDQIGQVGRQLTLNGGASTPKGDLKYRWIQVGGPEARLKLEDGYIFSFVPEQSGVYRFALIVADANAISQPDTVEVVIRPAPSSDRPSSTDRNTPSISTALPVADVAPTQLDHLTKEALARLPEGVELSSRIEELFETLAFRMNLYSSYGEVLREMAERLSAILPVDPTQKAAWDQLLFQPLSQRLIQLMLPAGLDLRTPQGQVMVLTDVQKSLLAEQFRLIAAGAQALAEASASRDSELPD